MLTSSRRWRESTRGPAEQELDGELLVPQDGRLVHPLAGRRTAGLLGQHLLDWQHQVSPRKILIECIKVFFKYQKWKGDGIAQRQRSRFSSSSPGFDSPRSQKNSDKEFRWFSRKNKFDVAEIYRKMHCLEREWTVLYSWLNPSITS